VIHKKINHLIGLNDVVLYDVNFLPLFGQNVISDGPTNDLKWRLVQQKVGKAFVRMHNQNTEYFVYLWLREHAMFDVNNMFFRICRGIGRHFKRSVDRWIWGFRIVIYFFSKNLFILAYTTIILTYNITIKDYCA